MEFSVGLLISGDKRGRLAIVLPHLFAKPFQGTSLARLIDDVTRHLMETIPKEDVRRLPDFDLCPHVEHRKVKVETENWKGRLSVVLSRYEENDFWLATVPRMGPDSFALEHPRLLSAVLSRRFAETPAPELEAVRCLPMEYLEVLTFEADPPTILPSRPRKKKKKKKKKTKPEQASTTVRSRPKKRRMVVPATLREVAANLTHRAMDRRLPRAFQRDRLVEDITKRLKRPGAAILLVGPSGVGKSALVHEVTHRLYAEAPRIEDRTEVWQVDGHRIIAGMRVVGAWENRVQRMVEELSIREDILFVDDLPALAFTGRSAHGDTNVADHLEPHLARGEIRMIGECTEERLQILEEESPSFLSRFSIVRIPPMSEEETMMALVHAARAYAEEEDVRVLPDALETILLLTRRFQGNQVFPGKAMGLLYRLLADRRGERRDPLGRDLVPREDVVRRYAEETGLPDFVLWEKSSRSAGHIEEHFSARVIGQPDAQEAAVDVVTLLEQGLNDPERPLASYLFIGPTGVGKTETAKALAAMLFKSERRLVRLDMSEFRTYDSVRRLFGDRYQPDGELTLAVSRTPFCVVLLDEIEKAHPAVFDALLQVLGEGRLTNAAGRTVDFSSTIVVMTSNLGVREAGSQLGFGEQSELDRHHHYQKAAEAFFRPEFFNRIDRVVAFSSLGKDAIAPLVRRLMERLLARRGLAGNRVVVSVDPHVVELVQEQGFDPKYGARAVKRLLEKRLAVPLATHLAKHYSRDLTIADVYPKAAEIQLELTWPEHRPIAAAGFEPPANWRALERRLDAIDAHVDRLLADEVYRQIEHRQQGLLADFNQGGISEDDNAELDQLSRVLTTLKSLPEEASSFRAQHFEAERFEVRLAVERGEDWKDTKSLLSEKIVPIQLDQGPLLDHVRLSLYRLEARVARVGFGLRCHADAGPRRALLMLSPVSKTEATRWWAAQMIDGLRLFFSEWGSVELLSCADQAWTKVETAQAVDAHALLIRGAGCHELARRFTGLYAEGDEVARVLRLELVEGDGDPIPRLAGLQSAESEWRQRRREDQVDDPRPSLPLRAQLDSHESGGWDLARWLRNLTDAALYQELSR